MRQIPDGLGTRSANVKERGQFQEDNEAIGT
jgi:hypothetical protein